MLISYTSAALQVMYSGERIFSSMFSNHSGQSIFCVSFELFIIEIKSDAVEHITLAAFSYPSPMRLFMRLAPRSRAQPSAVSATRTLRDLSREPSRFLQTFSARCRCSCVCSKNSRCGAADECRRGISCIECLCLSRKFFRLSRGRRARPLQEKSHSSCVRAPSCPPSPKGEMTRNICL